MGKLKAEIKMSVAREMGVRMDDLLEAARAELNQLQGAKQALHQASKRIEEHLKVVDKDVDDGKINLEQCDVIKRYVDQCGGLVRNLAVGAETQILITQGRITALEQSVKEVKRVHDISKAKVEAFNRGDLIEEETIIQKEHQNELDFNRRNIGEHPGDPLAERRGDGTSKTSANSDLLTSNRNPDEEKIGGQNT